MNNKEFKEHNIKVLGNTFRSRQNIYCAVTYSGETRKVKVLIVVDDEILDITQRVASALGMRYSEKLNTISVRGHGFGAANYIHECLHSLYPEKQLRYRSF